jgi:hypothetical protein
MTTPGQVGGGVTPSQSGGFITVNFSWAFYGSLPAPVDHVQGEIFIDGQGAGQVSGGASRSASCQVNGEGRSVSIEVTAYSAANVELASRSASVTTQAT